MLKDLLDAFLGYDLTQNGSEAHLMILGIGVLVWMNECMHFLWDE